MIIINRGVVRGFSKGAAQGKESRVQGKGCPLLGKKIFNFLTSLDAFSGHFLTIL